VLDGLGASSLARSLGAVVVPGAAGALPSVADLLDALGHLPTGQVLVLPGHPNVVPTARQAAELAATDADIDVAVVESAATPPAVLAALAVIDASAPFEQVLADARAAAAAVRSGSVVTAVRDAGTPVGPVRRGQPLATVGDEVVAACDDPLQALQHVCERLDVEAAEIVTLLVGAAVSADERARAVALLSSATAAEVEVVDAGQRPARYWVGAE
jgi:uncharacterized protein